MSVQQIHLDPARCLPEAEADALAGIHLAESSYDVLLRDSADVYKPGGTPLVRFRKAVIPAALCRAAYPNLRDAATPTDNRGLAGGEVRQARGDLPTGGDKVGTATRTRLHVRKEDGSLSNVSRARVVESGIIGYFDRTPRFPYCRTTAYNLEHPDRFAAALPFIQAVSEVFRQEEPGGWARQRAMIERTHPDFVIHNTVFTTVTVNRNWQTAVHKDAGDYAGGFGVMTAFTAGGFDGCYLCFPRYRVAVDFRTTDVLLADVHEWHGNTPIRPTGPFERVSCVFYYRENMFKCASADDEVEIAKRRQPGQPMYADYEERQRQYSDGLPPHLR